MPHRLYQPKLWQTLRFRFGAGALLSVSVIFMLAALNTQQVLEQAALESSRANARQVAQTLVLALAPLTEGAEARERITPYLQELVSPESSGVVYLALYDEGGHLLARTTDSPQPMPLTDNVSSHAWRRGVLHLDQPMLLGDQQVGRLRYGLSTQVQRDASERLLQQNLLTYGASMLVLALALVLVLSRLGQRLRTLSEGGAQLARGNYDCPVPTVGHDELTLVGLELNAMADAVRMRVRALEESQDSVRRLNEELEARVERRTAELSQANQNLQTTLADLRRLQDDLVQAEKLASLGSLVAAVAHELNTPIGNALTVATSFRTKAAEFDQQARIRLQRQTLDQFLSDSVEASVLMQRNLHKASELITSFKHVAIDQTSSQRRNFDLAETIGDVLATLSPSTKHRPIVIETQLEPGLRLNSYPGPLGQVLTNLYNNVLTHAFDADQRGVMRIQTRRVDDDHVAIDLSDNGRGMDAATLKRVFDPFFTTRLGQGGSGLGMNIVHNIVVGLLHGRIDIDSQPGQGTRVQLLLPTVAPLSGANAASEAAASAPATAPATVPADATGVAP